MKKNETKQKLAFASADIFGGGSFNVINFLYPSFLALTVGLNLYLVGIIMLVTRAWDAISDPLNVSYLPSDIGRNIQIYEGEQVYQFELEIPYLASKFVHAGFYLHEQKRKAE